MNKTHREKTVLQIIESLRRVFKTFQTASQKLQDTLGITMSQSWALFSIKERKSLTLAELSKMMFVRPSTASVVVDRLVDKGYVAKRRMKKDQRSVAIALTPSGEAFLERIPRLSVSNLARGLEAWTTKTWKLSMFLCESLLIFLMPKTSRLLLLLRIPLIPERQPGRKRRL
jgi:DNA-binding MarR family transcriptional regulator